MSNTNTMIFTLTAELKEVLNLFAREAGKNKTGSAYPEAVLASGNILSAANGAIMLRYQLGEDETGLMPTVFEKPVLIPIKGIRAIIDANIGTEITIAATRSAIAIAKSKKKSGKIELSALDASTFPEFGKFDFAGIDKVQVGDFDDAVSATRISIADTNPKPIYTGLFFQSDGEFLSFSAIDGHRASVVKLPYKTEETFKVSIPKTCLETVLAAISKRDSNDTLSIVRSKDNRHAAFFVGSRLVIQTRLLDGEPVDVSTFFKEGLHNVKLNRTELLGVLKSIAVVKEDIHLAVALTFKFDDKEVALSYKGNSVSVNDCVSITTEEENSEPVRIGVNIQYLTDALKAINSQQVEFSFNSPVAPITLKDTDENTDNKQLVVPVRLSD